MFRILEATRGLCLPLPPGYHTLLAVLAVRCLPHQTFLQYIDHGFLQLTETFLSRLMTDLDNSEANERLKFSILKRLPEVLLLCVRSSVCVPGPTQRIFCYAEMRSSPGLSATPNDDTSASHSNCSASVLALNPFEETENVDARFVEETALKQTLILLGFDTK
uniref:Gamma-secretase-activating protein C-terminal domain-containing protein n=1 Tax=Seriola dumerili TaxID=41447 RepID=A0A3B4TT87_SERDU